MRGGTIYAGKPRLQRREGSEWVCGLPVHLQKRCEGRLGTPSLVPFHLYSLGLQDTDSTRSTDYILTDRETAFSLFLFVKLKSSGPTFSFLSAERETSTFYFCYWHLQRRAALLSWGHRGLNREASQLDNVVGKKNPYLTFYYLSIYSNPRELSNLSWTTMYRNHTYWEK